MAMQLEAADHDFKQVEDTLQAAVAASLKLDLNELEALTPRGAHNEFHTTFLFKKPEAIAKGYELEKALLANEFNPLPDYPIHRLYMEEVFSCGAHALGATHLCDWTNDGNVTYLIPDPTAPPTPAPSATPTFVPTPSPTHTPTEPPTSAPTETPTEVPTTLSPTTDDPTFLPTTTPTERPTHYPTRTPTDAPTHYPTRTPTKTPAWKQCKDVCYKDKCKGTWTNPIPNGQTWTTKPGYYKHKGGCCAWGASKCTRCCTA
jgi:hypothetical protein